MISNRSKIKYVVIDVDGTMTDAGVYYDEHGNELKKFNTRDAAAFFVAQKVGIQIIVITGRECKATERRMKELGVSLLFQNIKDKLSFLLNYLEENHIDTNQVGYIGDDLNDLAPMKMVGFKACPLDSCKEIKEISDYVSMVNGGFGVVRDVFENCVVKEQWASVVSQVYSGI